LAALLHGIPAVGVSQTLWCGSRNGITELSQRAPPIFGWAVITLGFGTHSFISFLLLIPVTLCMAAVQIINDVISCNVSTYLFEQFPEFISSTR